MRKRGIPEVMVRAVMSLYEGAKTRVRVGLQLSKEFEVKVGVHQGSVLSPLVFVRMTPRLGRDFVCGRCVKQVDGLVELVEELCEEVETVRGFCFLGNMMNASCACEAAVTARARIG